MNDKKTKEVDGRESVSMLPGVTVGVMIAVIAFVLSFDALRLVFVSSGINPLLSWGGPLCVDGTILLCTWATWGFRKGHIRGRWYPWAGLVLFSLFSVTGNALHAWLNAGGMLPTWGAPAIMSIPPIALLYSTHLIVIIAGDRQDKLARTTGKAAGPDDGHAGPAAATPETAGTEPVRKEPRRTIPTPTAGPEPAKTAEPASPSPLDRYLFDRRPRRKPTRIGKEGGSGGGHPVRPGPHMADDTTPAPAIEPRITRTGTNRTKAGPRTTWTGSPRYIPRASRAQRQGAMRATPNLSPRNPTKGPCPARTVPPTRDRPTMPAQKPVSRLTRRRPASTPTNGSHGPTS
ncbi:MAG: DUF2637 domain-containing protein [Bifidobacterium adolescentis]